MYGNESPIAPKGAYREPFTGDEEIRVLGSLQGWRTPEGLYISKEQHQARVDEYIHTHGKPGGTSALGLFDSIAAGVGKVVHDVAGEYVRADAKTIATHLLFKNEIITTGMEIAESKANRGATGWVGAVGAVSESMDQNPGADALMAVGGGLAWMTGGLTLPLLVTGGKTVLGDAAKSVQAQADARANASQSAPKTTPPPASAPMEMDFLARIWNWILDLLASLGLDYRTSPTANTTPPTAGSTPPTATPTATPNPNGVLPAVSPNSGASRLGKK